MHMRRRVCSVIKSKLPKRTNVLQASQQRLLCLQPRESFKPSLKQQLILSKTKFQQQEYSEKSSAKSVITWKHGSPGSFDNNIPLHLPTDTTLVAQRTILGTWKGTPGRVITLLDGPGMGKTRTIRVAVQNTNSACIEIPMRVARLIPAFDFAALIITKAIEKDRIVTGAQVSQIMLQIGKSVLATALSLAANDVMVTGEAYSVITENGVKVPMDIEELLSEEFELSTTNMFEQAINKYKEALTARNLDHKVIVVHHDECQMFDTPTKFSRKTEEAVHASEVQHYRMIGYGSAMVLLSYPFVNILTGTSSSLEKMLRVDSGIKVQMLPRLDFFDSTKVKAIIEYFCDFSGIDPSYLEEMYHDLEGNPRLVQYFLNNLPANAAESNVRDLLDSAQFAAFSRMSVDISSILGNSVVESANMLLLCVQYPALFEGKYYKFSGVLKELTGVVDVNDRTFMQDLVVAFDGEDVPEALRLLRHSGMARISLITGKVLLHFPYKFLIKFWIRYSKVLYEGNVLDAIMAHVASSIGSGSVGTGFQVAVALELTNPASPLLKRILNLFGDRPISKRVHQLKLALSEKPMSDMSSGNPTVYTIQDLFSHKDKVADISFPALDQQNNLVRYNVAVSRSQFNEAKEARDNFVTFFQKSTADRNVAISYFGCVDDHSRYPNEPRKSPKSDVTELQEQLAKRDKQNALVEGPGLFEGTSFPFYDFFHNVGPNEALNALQRTVKIMAHSFWKRDKPETTYSVGFDKTAKAPRRILISMPGGKGSVARLVNSFAALEQEANIVWAEAGMDGRFEMKYKSGKTLVSLFSERDMDALPKRQVTVYLSKKN